MIRSIKRMDIRWQIHKTFGLFPKFLEWEENQFSIKYLISTTLEKWKQSAFRAFQDWHIQKVYKGRDVQVIISNIVSVLVNYRLKDTFFSKDIKQLQWGWLQNWVTQSLEEDLLYTMEQSAWVIVQQSVEIINHRRQRNGHWLHSVLSSWVSLVRGSKGIWTISWVIVTPQKDMKSQY